METTSLRSAIRRLTAGLALATVSATGFAQDLPLAGGVMSPSKSEAILGSVSALDRLLAQQGAASVSTPALVPASGLSRAALAPDLMSSTGLTPAELLRDAVVREPVPADRPDVFDSVALPVGASPLQARWARVEHSAPDAPASRFANSLSDRTAFQRLEAVNLYVNRRVHFVADSTQYGVADYWAPAAQTLTRGRGDCEDFAIAKLAMLRRAGFAEKDLYLVVAHDLVRRQDHAVAVARADGKYWLLDSGTDELLDASQAHDYRPVLSFSGTHSWTHGYRRTAPLMTLAAAPVAPTVKLASR